MAFGLIANEGVIDAWKPKPLARLTDGSGLCLRASPVAGRRHAWRLDYTFDLKRQTLSLGVYPNVSLKLAREKALKILRQVAEGINPSADRKQQKAALRAKREAERRILAGEVPQDSFEDVARRWYATRKSEWSESHASRVIRRLEMHAFPHIGRTHIAEIDPPKMLEVCRRIEQQGKIETAHRVLELASAVFCFGVGEGLRALDPCRDLGRLLQTPQVKHFAAITNPKELAALLRAMPNYQGTAVVCAALQLMPMIFLRPGEFRKARWEEIDLDNGMWLVPSARMKRTKQAKLDGGDHYVPLARQAVEILEELFLLTGSTGMVFPAEGRPGRTMSDGTINAALATLGYSSDTVTGHGFRATARTLLHERLSVDKDVIELQLAHEVKDANGRAYNRTEFLQARQKMMQVWADYLEDLREGRIDHRTHADLPLFTPVTRRLEAQL